MRRRRALPAPAVRVGAVRGARPRSKGRRALNVAIAAVVVAAILAVLAVYGTSALEGQAMRDLAQGSGPGTTAGQEAGIDWEALRAENPAVAAWLTVEGTPIDYPVLQATEDDPSFWLSRNFWGERSLAGSAVIDPATDAYGPHTLVYGHHVDDWRAFSPLWRAWTPEVFSSLGTVTWSVPEGPETFRPLFAFRCDKADPEVQRFDFSGGADGSGCDVASLRSWLSSLGTRAEASAEGWQETAGSTSRVLTLVTCSSPWAGQRGRTVVVCARV